MSRSKLGLATWLGLSVLGYVALVGRARRTLVADPPPAELESALQGWLREAGLEAIHRYVHTPVGRVHVLLAGRGERAVLVLPGLGASSGDFAELLTRLGRHHRVAAIDLPGSGLSDPVSFQGHPRRAWNQVVKTVADELGLTDFTLVGHSLGGLAAGGFAIANPGRVRQLVLISPLGLSRRVPLLWTFAMVPGVMDLRGLYERTQLVRHTGRRQNQPRSAVQGVAETAWDKYRLLTGLRFGRGSDLGIVGRLFKPSGLRTESQLLPALGLLSGRTLVLWGGHDRRLPLHDSASELQPFKGLKLKVVPGAGHLLPVVEPSLTAQLITDFLKIAGR
ncbi:MAG TPA: alpha/beta hydrolase [Candidatus Nanopelagicaceae bacterium]|nr:alpha/beta hydrolase [Candidatus Nanopelagicaceae bacterium]